jgi:hypothetical protein
MKAGHDHDAFFFDEIKDCVRKFPHEHAPHLFMYFREGRRVSLHSRQTGVGGA